MGMENKEYGIQPPVYTPPEKSTLPDNWGTEHGGGGGGSDNYNDLSNKPSINGTTLAGDKTAAQLQLVDLKGIQAFATMPSNAVAGTTIMYTGTQGAYLTGAVYRYTNGAWTMLMSPTEAASISQAEIEELF